MLHNNNGGQNQKVHFYYVLGVNQPVPLVATLTKFGHPNKQISGSMTKQYAKSCNKLGIWHN
jgi:hypothetical protein